MTGKEIGGVVWHAGGECTCNAVVVGGHAKEGSGDGMSFNVVFLGEAGNKAVKMFAVGAFDTARSPTTRAKKMGSALWVNMQGWVW
jgi:hypothetical protein